MTEGSVLQISAQDKLHVNICVNKVAQRASDTQPESIRLTHLSSQPVRLKLMFDPVLYVCFYYEGQMMDERINISLIAVYKLTTSCQSVSSLQIQMHVKRPVYFSHSFSLETGTGRTCKDKILADAHLHFRCVELQGAANWHFYNTAVSQWTNYTVREMFSESWMAEA